MRWDKKYPERVVSAPRHHRLHVPLSSSSLVPLLPPPSCVITILRLCSVHQHRQHCRHQRAPALAAAEAPTRLAIGLEYQGCLHRATGLHHCLRRSANHHHHRHHHCHHRQPASATLALFTLRPSPAFCLRHPPPLRRADSAENMNIIRRLRIRRSHLPSCPRFPQDTAGSARRNARRMSREFAD